MDGATLRAVLTVDFDVGALSTFIARPALDHARSVVYTRDGTMLAYPAATLPATDKLLRHEDLKDPALEALFAANATGDGLHFVELGDYLASVAPIGGKRAGVPVPLDWYVATLVPAATLLGPTHRLERSPPSTPGPPSAPRGGGATTSRRSRRRRFRRRRCR